MLVFRVATDKENLKEGREFVLVREMTLASRADNGPFPYLQCELPAESGGDPSQNHLYRSTTIQACSTSWAGCGRGQNAAPKRLPSPSSL